MYMKGILMISKIQGMVAPKINQEKITTNPIGYNKINSYGLKADTVSFGTNKVKAFESLKDVANSLFEEGFLSSNNYKMAALGDEYLLIKPKFVGQKYLDYKNLLNSNPKLREVFASGDFDNTITKAMSNAPIEVNGYRAVNSDKNWVTISKELSGIQLKEGGKTDSVWGSFIINLQDNASEFAIGKKLISDEVWFKTY